MTGRCEMVEKQLRQRGVTDPRVLEAMGRVPRHRFVLPAARSRAYEDRPLPIGYQQTISQPYVVALMTQIVSPRPSERLDVGTGSGYQAALWPAYARRFTASKSSRRLPKAPASCCRNWDMTM